MRFVLSFHQSSSHQSISIEIYRGQGTVFMWTAIFSLVVFIYLQLQSGKQSTCSHYPAKYFLNHLQWPTPLTPEMFHVLLLHSPSSALDTESYSNTTRDIFSAFWSHNGTSFTPWTFAVMTKGVSYVTICWSPLTLNGRQKSSTPGRLIKTGVHLGCYCSQFSLIPRLPIHTMPITPHTDHWIVLKIWCRSTGSDCVPNRGQSGLLMPTAVRSSKCVSKMGYNAKDLY